MSEDPNNNNNPNNNNEEEKVDDYYDYLPADHPLLKRLQNALEDQLKSEEESLRLLHKEREEELKKIKRTREDIGINLYSFQQQYAKLEDVFSEKYQKYMLLKEQREKIEKRLSEETKIHNEKASAVREQNKLVITTSEELNQLNAMLKYVESYNNQVGSEIKVTKTTTQVVEKKIQGNESLKKEQDFLIDYLDEQVKILTEKKLLYEAQYKSQQNETAEARLNLQEARREIENILERKRNLMKDWDKSLISMKTRDKALQVVRDNIKEQDGEKLKFTSQITRYNEMIQNEIFQNNTLNFEIRKSTMKQKVIDSQIKEHTVLNKHLEEKTSFLIMSISKTKDEINALILRENGLRNDIELIEKNKLKLMDESRQLNEKIVGVISSKETHEKQKENLMKSNLKLLKDVFDLQVEVDAKVNEMARVEIDRLNVEMQNEALKKKLKLMNKEITKLEMDYTKQEVTIKKNHENLEKKQLTVDHLNKKFGEITKNKGSEDEGLFEVKIKELQSEIKNLNKQIQESEQDWIVKKTNLVNKEGILNEVNEDCVNKRSKKMILENKKMRLNKNYEQHEKEIREIEISLKNLRYDMNKYNGQLSKNIKNKDNLSHKFFDVEIEFKEKLKQMENESVKLEIEIEVLREEKSDTLTQIMEVERQIHLWERKIHLEEKMQDIIKPDKGLKEIDEMKSEIHRQEIYFNNLKKEQERVIKDMEMTIQRRDYIKLRYPLDDKNFVSSSNAYNDRESFKNLYNRGNEKIVNSKMKKNLSSQNDREIQKLKEDLNHIVKEKNEIVNGLRICRENIDLVSEQIEKSEMEHLSLQRTAMNIQNEFFSMKLRNNLMLCKTKQNQDCNRIIEDYTNNRFRPKKKDDILREITKISTETEQVIDILKNFKDTHPEWGNIINEAMNI
jgi:chromosome segregation ATPase